jgi:hypothetical protein
MTIAAAVTLLWATSQVHAYGAAHAGYTHVGPNGVQHVGYTAHSGPYSSGGTVHTSGTTGAGGAYGSTYHTGSGGTYGGYHGYTPTGGGGAAVGGYHYGTTGGGVNYGGAAVYRP